MEHTRREKSSVVSRRLFRYSPYFLVAISAVLIPALLALRVDAEVAVFISDNYLEEEIVHDGTLQSGVKHITRERKWSNFQGAVPDGATVHKIVLRLGWSEDIVIREDISPSSTPLDEPLTESELLSQPTTTADATVSTSTLEENTLTGEVTDSTQETDTLIEESTRIEDVSDPSSPDIEVPTGEILEETQKEEIDAPSNTVDEGVPAEVSEFEQISFSHVYPLTASILTLATLTPPVLEEVVSSEDPSLEMELEEIESEIVATSSTSTDFVIPDGFLEIRYSVDGVTWHVLDMVEYKVITNAEFLLMFVALEAVSSLEVSARYSVVEGDTYTIHFDTVRVEAEYETVPEPVEFVEEILNDQEPNFSNSSIKTDVSSENIRAVVLERGGMLEFWYSITDIHTDEVMWRRLAGGGEIQNGAPIAIKERTVFWFDRNQETLFGYAVDSESIFGVPYDNPEERVFRLPFVTEDGEQWYVTHDPDDTSLKFERVRNANSR